MMINLENIQKIGFFSRFKDFSVLQRGKDLTDNDVQTGKFPVVKSNGVQIYHNQYFVEPPGVVTGRSGTIGKVFFIDEKFWAHNTTLYVKDFKGNYPKFIYYLILRMDFRRYYAGTTVPTLNRNDIHRLKIAIPKNYDEQKDIADKFDECDKIIHEKQIKIQTLQRLKKSLMQNLLTGKVRLKPDIIKQLNNG
jgi:type I restriction enzyme, S subunit